MDNDILLTSIFSASIEFGIGCIKNLADRVRDFNISKALIVADKGIIKAGILDKVLGNLDKSDIEYTIFDNVQLNPIDKNVMDGLEVYRENRCNAIIGVGGGSPIDVAKAIRVVVTHPGHISNYYSPDKITEEMPPIIAIPTTSGTGTEVSTGGIITDTGDNRKRVVRSGPP